MYKLVENDIKATWTSGAVFRPIATLADEHGGRAQITKDDGCYVLLLRQENGLYKPTPWIFPAAFEAFKRLPSLIGYCPECSSELRLGDGADTPPLYCGLGWEE